ncbi:uncharacterized protein E0L32_012176 [Thyridium curvatum]|uniref:Uncharacterized protein n=1 Tax=Thyridium curvatum TaxID=1093900 RepID=A0A507BBS1_9PEZI|nr:uncharacterized protein E0L32_012176 [Thyridium curvatum]TPX17347.1 hypothetical protein E0L32_012176 [Thyridium curvatum]
MDAQCGCSLNHVYLAIDGGATYTAFATTTRRICNLHNKHEIKAQDDGFKVPSVLYRNPSTGDIQYLKPETGDPNALVDELRYFKFSLMQSEDWRRGLGDAAVRDLIETTIDNFQTRMSTSDITAVALRATYPHGWDSPPGEPRRRLEKAVEISGLAKLAHTVRYCTEHEAAVQAVLHDHRAELQAQLQDAAVYELKASDWVGQYLVKTCVMTGSMAMDLAFRRLTDRKMRDVYATLPLAIDDPVARKYQRAILTEWEEIKFSFDSSRLSGGSHSFRVFHPSDLPQAGAGPTSFEERSIGVHRDEFISIFAAAAKAVAEVIVDLHRHPGSKHPKFVFLTGGLAANIDICERVKDLVKMRLGADGPIICCDPDKSWTTVARGAAMDGLVIPEDRQHKGE